MRTNLGRALHAWLVVALVAGCRNTPAPTRMAGEPSQAPSSESSAPSGRQTATVKTRMGEHFSKATEAKSALVRGDLERARTAARSLAESEWSSNLRPDWRPYMQELQNAARAVASAADTSRAAQGVGRMGEACASCHVVAGGPKLTPPEAPDAGPASEFQPMRHVWAVDRMWEGLIAPSEDSWRRGSAALASAPFEPAVRIATREVPAEVAVVASRVHEFGRRAQMVDVDRRGWVLGDVLATCASCHQRLDISVP